MKRLMVVFSMILCVIEVSAVKKFDFKMCELSRQVIIGDNNDMLISIIGESAFASIFSLKKTKFRNSGRLSRKRITSIRNG